VALTADDENFDSPLVWSRDGREIFYQQRAGHRLDPQARPAAIKAVDVSNKTTRTVDAQYSNYDGLALSADGTRLYFAASEDDSSDVDLGRGLYSVSVDGEDPVLLAWPVNSVWRPPGVPLSPDNIHVAYSGGDSLFVHNVANDQRLFLATSAEPLVFSPDGRRLLFTDWDPDWVPGGPPEYTDLIFDLDTGEKEPVSLGPTRSGRRFSTGIHLKAVRWDVNGIRVLYWRLFEREYFIYDVSRGVETRLAFDLREGETGTGFVEAWSEDGSKLAFRSSACLRRSSGSVFGYTCYERETHLHVTDADGRGDTIVAVAYVGGNVWTGRAAFAPDGKRIAYIIGGRIYMQEIS
jgi:Tol biopolymer transport system component